MDTFLNVREPEVNNGRLGHLHLGMDAGGRTKNALLWFDLDDIPKGALVREAFLFLFGRDVDPDVPLCVFGLRRGWEEYQATWRQARDDDPWGLEGALQVGVDRGGECVPGTFRDGGLVQFYEWDVSSLVQQWANDMAQNHGFLVATHPDSKAKEAQGLYSREYSEFGLRPLLSIAYFELPPTSTPTLTPTTTPTPTETATPTATLTPTPTATLPGPICLPLVFKTEG